MSEPFAPSTSSLTSQLRARQRGAGAGRLIAVVLGLAVIAGGGWYYYQSRNAPETAQAPGGDPAKDGAPGKGGGAGKGAGKGGGGRERFGAGSGVTPVLVATAAKETIDIRLTALGTVTPRNAVTVRTRVDGPLLRVLFKEGQMIKAGELLAEIDPLPLQAALTQAAGQLARDQALLQNAQIDLERYQGLMKTDSIPKQQLDTQAATVRQYQGVVATDRGQVEAARLQLSYARITAPISGQIGLRQVDPGNIVKAGDTNGIVSITQLDPITVVSAIPEVSVPALLARIRAGGDVPVEAWDSGLKNLLVKGKLLSTDNQIDTSTGTLKLKAEFSNPTGVLFPNQFVNVRILIGQETDSVVIRQAAVQRGAQGTYVYVIKDDSTVTVRVVKTGVVDGERVAITAGLEPGERVVVDGADKLREGAKVEVIERGASGMPPGLENQKGGGDRKGGRRGDKGGKGRPDGAAPGAVPGAAQNGTGAPAASAGASGPAGGAVTGGADRAASQGNADGGAGEGERRRRRAEGGPPAGPAGTSGGSSSNNQ
jgi:multidrug efflux system membrane fusion protein